MSGIIEVNGEQKHQFDFRVAPFPQDVISEEALAIGGVTEAQIREHKSPREIYKVLITLLSKYVDRYDRNDKFTMVGYRVDFDDQMLRSWFKKLGDQYYGSWFSGYRLDVYALVCYLNLLGKMPTKSGKLRQEDVADLLGMEYDAHNSLEDVRITRKLLYKFTEMFGYGGLLGEVEAHL